MSSSVGDSVLDFDLNFLHPTPDKTVLNTSERKKSIYMVKKKTISADTLIRDFYAKKEALDQAEKDLLTAKEECKQTCIQYKKSQDAYAQLEKKLQLLVNNNKDWEGKYASLENQYAAANSHVHQLQTLVKQQETIIESLKIENKLSKPSVKDIDKKTMQSLQKECDMLRKHICLAKNIAFGNIKLSARHKMLLKKYDKYDRRNKYDSLFGEESNDEYASDEIALSPFSEDYVDEADLSKINKPQNGNARRKETISLEQFRIPSNSSHECNDLVSIDTGRGSSRACSGSDKCFQSPDYFNDDNLLCDDPVLDKIKIKLVDSTTSPIPGPVTIHVATSPINFHHPVVDRGVSPIIVLSTTHKNKTVEKCATNSIVSVSPKITNTIEGSNNILECEKTRKEKECLDLNNSVNICNESSNDCEIEMILSSMRLDSKMITPIPPTPAKPKPDNKTTVHRTPRKKQKHLENDNTAKYHKRPLNTEQNMNDYQTVKLQDRLLLVLNKDGSYVIFNNHISLPSIIESSETFNKYLPILTNNENPDKVGENDGSINVPFNNRNSKDVRNNTVVTTPDNPERAEQNNVVVETYEKDEHNIAMDVDELNIVTSCNIQRIVNNNSSGIKEIPHPHESIAMDNLNEPIMVPKESLKINKNLGKFIETLRDDEVIVMDDNNETKTDSDNYVLLENVNVDGQTIANNEPMTVDNGSDFFESDSDERVITDNDNEIVVTTNEDGTVTVTNNYRLLETLNNDPMVTDNPNETIETPNTSKAITVDTNNSISETCRDIQSNVTVKDNEHGEKHNKHKTMTVSNKYRLFEDSYDMTDNDDGIIVSADNHRNTVVDNSYSIFGNLSDDDSIENGKDDRTVLSSNHETTNVHINDGIFGNGSVDHANMMNKDDSIVISLKHNATTIVPNDYELFKNLSEDDLNEKDLNMVVGNKRDGTDYEPGKGKDDKTITISNNHGTTAMSNKIALIDEKVTTDNNKGTIPTSGNQAISTICSKYDGVADSDVRQIIPDNNMFVTTLGDGETMIMDKNCEIINTPVTPETTTVDNNYCVAEILSDEGSVNIDKKNEINNTHIIHAAKSSDNNDCVAETLSDDGLKIMYKNNDISNIPIMHTTTFSDNNDCVAELVTDEGPMTMYKNNEIINTPIIHTAESSDNYDRVTEIVNEEGPKILYKNNEIVNMPIVHAAKCNDNKDCVTETLSDEGPMIVYKNNEMISTPIIHGTSTSDNNYFVPQNVSDEGPMIIDKSNESVIHGTSFSDNNYGVAETLCDEGTVIMDTNNENISTSITQGSSSTNNIYCVAETLSDKGTVIMDRNNEKTCTAIVLGTKTINNSSSVAETLNNEGPMLMNKNHANNSTSMKQQVTIDDSNYCVSNTASQEVSMITGKNCKIITTSSTNTPIARGSNYGTATNFSDDGPMIMDKKHQTNSTPIKHGNTTNDNNFCVPHVDSNEVSEMTSKNCEAVKTHTKLGTTTYGNNYCIAEILSHKGLNLTNKDNETSIIPNTKESLVVETTNGDVTVHEKGNKCNINKIRETTIRSKVCKSDEKKATIKKQSPRSRRKSSLFCVMEELSNDNIQKDFINTVNRIEEKISKLQSETVKSTVNVTEKDHSHCDVNTETTAGGMSNDDLSASKADEGKLVKTRKLTKLGKLKQKLLPKYKIKREHLPLKRSVKLTEIISPNKKMTISEADSSATLNNKDAYEKAVQVVRELRRKKSISANSNEVVQRTKIPEKKSRIESDHIETDESTDSDCVLLSEISTPNQINTRSRKKVIEQSPINNSLPQASLVKSPSKGTVEKCAIGKDLTKTPESKEPKKQLKRVCEDTPSGIPHKRFLRNSTCEMYVEMEPKIVLRRFEDPPISTAGANNVNCKNTRSDNGNFSAKVDISPKKIGNTKRRSLREVTAKIAEHQETNEGQNITDNPKNSILCRMIQRYGVKTVNLKSKNVPDTIASSIAKKIEDGISRIIELPANETKDAMNKFVGDILNWNIKHFLAGLIKYLKDPQRRNEMYSKIVAPSAPALTKAEQILLYVVSELKVHLHSVDIVDKILNCMEYTLFALNRTPQFEVIESISHLYAVICRYFKMKTRLRLFILDAMYCIQFKAVPLIRQCIEVWMHILPLAHMASAKTPLVTCLVYLLHFYKCEDRLNRVQDIRTILQRKYFYNVTEWNEIKILELFRNSITSLRGFQTEIKMLRIALIILAKRQGPRWCQNNIVKNILQPIIETKNCAEHVKAFCLSMLGPLLKPFPADMKVHCEIVMNQLISMLQENPSPKIAEGIVTSMVYLNKHSQNRVIQALFLWRPQNISPELEVILKDFIKSKPLKNWKSTLSRVAQ